MLVSRWSYDDDDAVVVEDDDDIVTRAVDLALLLGPLLIPIFGAIVIRSPLRRTMHRPMGKKAWFDILGEVLMN